MFVRSAKRLALSALTAPPIYDVLRQRARLPGTTTVLCYHSLGPDNETFDAWTVLRAKDFIGHIEQLRKSYEIVALDDAFTASDTSKPRAVITFDDGDVGLYMHLLPIVQDQKIPVTVYISTGQIERGQPYWFDRVMNCLQAPDGFSIKLDLSAVGPKTWAIGPKTGEDRWLAISDILETLKSVAPELRDDLTRQIIVQAPENKSRFTPLAPMSMAQLKELAECPWITIGAHSQCHNLLDRIPETQARDSILRSQSDLESWTGRDVQHFAYPNGNHNAAVRSMLGEAGFKSAMALHSGFWRKDSDLFALPRMPIGRYDGGLARFRWRLIGR